MSQKSNSDSITRDYLDSLLIETRYIDSELPSTKMKLFSKEFDTPVTTAALSHLHTVCANGMVEYAKGAKGAEALHFVGMGDDKELEDIIETGAKTVKIIKPHADNDEVFRKIRHAEKAGALAVGMDIDHAFSGNGTYDCVYGLNMRPKSFEEIKAFVNFTSLPFIVKGVLSPIDAEKALKAGAAGIIVSHHHGIVDYSVPPLMALPEIKNAVGGEIPLFVDCGIESAMDVFKALALGATAVSIGRHLMIPLKEGGAAVTRRINELTMQLKSIMARTGSHSLSDIDPDVIKHRNF